MSSKESAVTFLHGNEDPVGRSTPSIILLPLELLVRREGGVENKKRLSAPPLILDLYFIIIALADVII